MATSAYNRHLRETFTGKKIPDVHEKLLAAEGSGILNWYLEGAQKLLKSITETGDIYQSGSQRARVKTLLSESDSLRIFLRESIVRVHGPNLTVDEIIDEYDKACIDAGWSPIPRRIAQEQLENFMLELFSVCKSNCVKREGKDRRGFFNIRFRQLDEA